MSEVRKRSRSFSNYDDDKHVYEKRARITELFQGLSLDKDSVEAPLTPASAPALEIPTAQSLPVPSIDHYISNKLYEHCHSMARAYLLLIRPYNPHFLVCYNLQKWIVRMFNRFILKYNKNHRLRVPPVKSCATILQWVKDGVLSLESLNLILIQENKLFMMEFAQKRLAADDQRIQELEREFLGIRYNYWDNIGLPSDEEMLPVDQCDDTSQTLWTDPPSADYCMEDVMVDY